MWSKLPLFMTISIYIHIAHSYTVSGPRVIRPTPKPTPSCGSMSSSDIDFDNCGENTAFRTAATQAASFILNNWNRFESDIEDEADVTFTGCLKNKLENGHINCVNENRGWPWNCATANQPWCGRASCGRSTINICEANFVNNLPSGTSDRSKCQRLACVATLMVHEFAHNCCRGHNTVNRIDIATLEWFRDNAGCFGCEASDFSTCPCISPGQEAFPDDDLYTDDPIDYNAMPEDNGQHYIYLKISDPLMIFVVGSIVVVVMLNVVSMIYCWCLKENKNGYGTVKTVDSESEYAIE